MNFFIMNGWDAVTLFFVISGFLITYLLLQERRETGSISVQNFLVRRTLRIWPLYFLVFALTMVLLPQNSPRDAYSILAVVLLSPHLPFVALGAIGMYWSLGVEEWFYLVWSSLVKRISIPKICLIIITVRFAFVLVFPELLITESKYTDPWLIFLRAIHFEAMAVGALGAWLFFHKHRMLRIFYRLNSFFWGIMLIVIVLPVDGGIVYDFVISIVFLGVLLNVSTNRRQPIRLEHPVLSHLGQVTFGIYVYHMLMIYFVSYLTVQFGFGDVFYLGGIVIGVIAVSILSYRWIEKPILRLKPYHRKVVEPLPVMEAEVSASI